MVRMLSLTENLHTILRVLYDDMMALCYPMSHASIRRGWSESPR